MSPRVGTVAAAFWLTVACAPPPTDPPPSPPAVGSTASSVPYLPALAPPREVRVTVEATLDGRPFRSERMGLTSVTLGFDAAPVRVIRVTDPVGTLDLERSDEGVFAVVDGARVGVVVESAERAGCEEWTIVQEWPPRGALSATSIEDMLVLCADGTLVARDRRTRFPLGARREGWTSTE